VVPKRNVVSKGNVVPRRNVISKKETWFPEEKWFPKRKKETWFPKGSVTPRTIFLKHYVLYSHETLKLVAFVNISLTRPEYSFEIRPIGPSESFKVRISKGKSQVQHGPGHTQQGPLILNILLPCGSRIS